MPYFNRLYFFYLLSLLKRVNISSQKTCQGFTLLELLITVIIVGILSSIAIPAYVATVDKFHYGEAKIHMGCIRRELQGFRMEKGHFPADVFSDRVPVGIECFLKNNTEQVPFDSVYDYENWDFASQCIVKITFFGKNGVRNSPARNTSLHHQPGFHQDPTVDGDDLILSLGVQPSEICSP